MANLKNFYDKSYERSDKIILARRSKGCAEVILCLWRGQFVTWELDLNGVTYWGHYLTDLEAAYKDYLER